MTPTPRCARLRLARQTQGTRPLLRALPFIAGAFVSAYVAREFIGENVGAVMLMGALIVGARYISAPKRDVIDVDVVLGADGLLMGDRFILASDIRRIEVGDARCRLVMRGEMLELHGSPEALAAARSVAASFSADAARRDQVGERYVLQHQDVSGPSAGYRAASFDVGRILDVAENPHADPRARIAAASVLGKETDPQTRARIAQAADACAHPQVNAALRESLVERSSAS